MRHSASEKNIDTSEKKVQPQNQKEKLQILK